MKKLIKTFILLAFIVALTGCMKINMNMEVKKDLTMDMNMEMLMQESMLTTIGYSKEEMISSMKEEIYSEMDRVEIEEIEKTIDGESWVGISITSDELTDLEGEKVLKKDGDIITLTLPMDELDDEMDMDDIENSGYTLKDLKNMGMEMNVTIKMPGKATANVGKVSGDTVTIDLLEIMSSQNNMKNIEIKADMSQKVASGTKDNTMLYITCGAGVVVIIGIIVFALMKKKKKSNHTEQEMIHFCPYCGNQLNGEDICPRCYQRIR